MSAPDDHDTIPNYRIPDEFVLPGSRSALNRYLPTTGDDPDAIAGHSSPRPGGTGRHRRQDVIERNDQARCPQPTAPDRLPGLS
jgi:hypothetical protein